MIDPVAIAIGPLAIRWYSLAYIFGLILGWRYCRNLARRSPGKIEPVTIDDYLVWATLGVVLGGRLGYILFYKLEYYLANPQEILFLWQGGMSFHGGMLGVLAASFLFARRQGVDPIALSDLVAAAAPIGLFLGRLANFINGELFGRVSDVPWAVVFPRGGDQPRHPSQLYEAGLEGLVLFVVLYVLVRSGGLSHRGRVGGAFLCGYGVSRFVVEFFREPDDHLGFLFAGATMGQLLSVPMILLGLALIIWSARRSAAPEA